MQLPKLTALLLTTLTLVSAVRFDPRSDDLEFGDIYAREADEYDYDTSLYARDADLEDAYLAGYKRGIYARVASPPSPPPEREVQRQLLRGQQRDSRGNLIQAGTTNAETLVKRPNKKKSSSDLRGQYNRGA